MKVRELTDLTFYSPPQPHKQGAEGAPAQGGEKLADSEDMEIQTNWDETTTTFDAMDLKEDLLRGIYAYGFEKPSAIQQRAVKPTLLGRDVIAQAQSGMLSVKCACLNTCMALLFGQHLPSPSSSSCPLLAKFIHHPSNRNDSTSYNTIFRV